MQERFGLSGMRLGQDAKAHLIHAVFAQGNAWCFAVKLHRLLEARVVAVQRPVSRIHGELLLVHAFGHVDAVRDAMAVGEDDRNTGIRFGLEKGFNGLRVATAHRNLCHIDALVIDGELPEVLAWSRLAARGELGDRSKRCAF